MQDRFENFTFLINKLDKIIQKIKNIEMKDYGLKAVHVMCIYHLSQSADGLTNKELVSLTLEDKAAISRALLLLKDNNYIDYEQNKYNGKIKLNDKGKELANNVRIKTALALENVGVGLTDEERVILYKSLGIIEANLDNYYHKLSSGEKNELF